MVDAEQLVPVDRLAQALRINGLRVGHEANGSAQSELVSATRSGLSRCGDPGGGANGLVVGALHPLNDPVEYTNVISKAGPKKTALSRPPEPVHVEYARQMPSALRILERKPVPQVVSYRLNKVQLFTTYTCK